MTLPGNDRVRAIRARQRSRTHLRAFAEPLSPTYEETAIDRVQISVGGSCARIDPASTLQDYFELVATTDDYGEWLATPTFRRGFLKLKTLVRDRGTIGFELTARSSGDDRAWLKVNFTGNPTMTLAHLLHRLQDEPDIVLRLRQLSPVEFFSVVSDVPRSLDNNTNWVADPDLAHRIFGPDVSSSFLPIYVQQLRSLTALLVRPEYGIEPIEDGGDDVVRSSRFDVRMEWGKARVPQCETYFERHHTSARAVARSAAQNVLTKLDSADVRHHLPQTGFERRGDQFSITTPLARELRLAIYAKSIDRLRFEVRRNKAGRYRGQTPTGPSSRLLEIFASERDVAVSCPPWSRIGVLLTEHGVPVSGDLVSLIALVERACTATGTDFRETLAAIVTDGGIDLAAYNRPLVEVLRQSGVLERTMVRQRDHSLPRRYSLTETYMPILEAIFDAFSGSDPAHSTSVEPDDWLNWPMT